VFEADPLGAIEDRSETEVRRDLYLINTDGTGLEQIVENDADDRHPVWSPDGSRIAFSSTRSGRLAKIYTVDPDGSNVLQLFELPGTSFGAYEPTWSPDGSRIAVHADAFGNFEIWMIDLETEEQTRLTFAGDIDKEPSWSPDGEQLVYASRRGGYYDIYILDVTVPNPQPVRVTSLPLDEVRPAWSPDGGQIAFESGNDDNNQIYVVGTDGSGLTVLTETGSAGSVSWSPDGQWLAFAWDQDDTDSEIFIMRRDGSDLRQLTDNDWEDSAPDWRPAP